MAGYANRTITLPFPELTEEGDETIQVTIRNPKTIPADALTPDKTGEDDNVPVVRVWYPVIARLVVDWHVYDGTVVGDDQPLLVEPSVENVGKLPRVIVEAVIEKILQALGVAQEPAGAGA